MATQEDLADEFIELAHRAAMSANEAALAEKKIKPKGCCYGCNADFVIDGVVAPEFAGDYTVEEMMEKLFCPTSADECAGYHETELKMAKIGGKA